jgi:hypothetical protein
MPHKKYKVTPTGEEENILQDIMDRGKHGAQKREGPRFQKQSGTAGSLSAINIRFFGRVCLLQSF